MDAGTSRSSPTEHGTSQPFASSQQPAPSSQPARQPAGRPASDTASQPTGKKIDFQEMVDGKKIGRDGQKIAFREMVEKSVRRKAFLNALVINKLVLYGPKVLPNPRRSTQRMSSKCQTHRPSSSY